MYVILMKPVLYLFSLLLLPVLTLAQTRTSALPSKQFTPKVNTIRYKLGDRDIILKLYHYGSSKELFFINLHDDEITAVAGAKKLLEKHGGVLLRIENDRERNILFRLNGKTYVFDPNRIFSRVGIIQTLTMYGRSDMAAVDELDKFSKRIIQLLPASRCIISLHNNSDGKYSINSYLVGRERDKDAKAIRVIPKQDPDDLFLTTDSSLFLRLTREKYNVVLQDNVNAQKDGSLSVYCGEKNICYLNCETQHGKIFQYAEMINIAARYARNTDTETIVYKYQLFPARDSSKFSIPYDIYFGEKKVGAIQMKEEPDDKIMGEMAIIKSFPLYDNMDFYYFRSDTKDGKIELRIDPTRAKAMHDPGTATITIRVIP